MLDAPTIAVEPARYHDAIACDLSLLVLDFFYTRHKYDVAVQAMEDKIKNGQVQGVTDPKEAKNIIRKGNFTYEQVKNIAKAGNIDSIKYDAANGAVTTTFGITTALTFAFNIWQGEDFSKSLELATYSGLKVGGTAFITTVLASQLSKAGLNSALVGSSETIVALMGPKASAVLINAFRGGSNIYGAAAYEKCCKIASGKCDYSRSYSCSFVFI